MRVLIQRVIRGEVEIKRKTTASIGRGLVIFLGVGQEDQEEDIQWLCGKICQMRIFNDSEQKMNLSLRDVAGEVMVVSQFTLFASTKKGNRPGFSNAASGPVAEDLYLKFIHQLEKTGSIRVQKGEFGADMKIHLINDGPVTIWMDSKQKE